ncbi:MAG: hypothetical protein WBE37_03620, partial [Bryobacteraceae bacterium]
MSRRKKLWLGGIAGFVVLLGVGAYIAASIIAKQFEPALRAQAIQYLHDRFHSDVELRALHIHQPKVSTIQILLRHGRGAIVAVEADGLSMRFGGDGSRPPLFRIQKVFFTVDLGVLFQPKKSVQFVSLEGMEINVPPKGERHDFSGDEASNSNVIIQNVQIKDAALILLPKDTGRKPLRFQIARLHLQSVGVNS